MAYIAPDPGSFAGQTVGNGQCVAYVRASSGAPASSLWTVGVRVNGNVIPTGAAIATFDSSGTYPNNTTGNHAAIYIEQDPQQGVHVWDQWTHHPVSSRWIAFKAGQGSPSNDGDAFSVIESSAILNHIFDLGEDA